jgi:hypothetical protein
MAVQVALAQVMVTPEPLVIPALEPRAVTQAIPEVLAQMAQQVIQALLVAVQRAVLRVTPVVQELLDLLVIQALRVQAEH